MWVYLGALFGRQPSSVCWGLHVGVFIVFFPAIFVAQKRLGTTHRKDFWKAITKGSPDGVRYMLYFFFAYAFVTGLLVFFQSPPGTVPNRDPALDWRGFSAVWMVLLRLVRYSLLRPPFFFRLPVDAAATFIIAWRRRLRVPT